VTRETVLVRTPRRYDAEVAKSTPPDWERMSHQGASRLDFEKVITNRTARIRSDGAWLLLALLLSLSMACGRNSSRPAAGVQPAAPTDWLQVSDNRPTIEAVARAPLDVAVTQRRLAYRVRPDARFLAAIGYIRRFWTAHPTASIRLTFDSGAWKLQDEDGTVGTLSETANYRDAVELLRTYAQKLNSAGPTPGQTSGKTFDPGQVQPQISEFLLPSLLEALHGLNQNWSRASQPEAAALAAHALVLVNLQALDRVGMADRLRARALAMLVISETLGNQRNPRDHALLASILEYPIDAAAFARELPPEDAARLYVLEDKDHLREAAERPGSERLAQYLALLQLGEPGEAAARARWTKWKDSHFFSPGPSLPVLRAGIDLATFDTLTWFGESLVEICIGKVAPQTPMPLTESDSEDSGRGPMAAITQAFQQWLRDLPTPASSRIGDFESGLDKLTAEKDGPFWGAEDERTLWRSYFYSGLHCLTTFTLDWLDSPEAAADLAKSFERAPPGPGSDFRLWFQELVAVRSGRPVGQDFLDHLWSSKSLGGPLLSRSLQEIPEFLAWHLGTRPQVAQHVFDRLDSRRSHREILVAQAFWNILDVSLTESLCAGTSLAGPGESSGWVSTCARLKGDLSGLLRVARDPTRSIWSRAHAIWQLQTVAPEREVRAAFEELFRADHFGTAGGVLYFAWLEGLERFTEGLSVCDRWLAHHGQEEGLTHVLWVARRALMLSRLGRDREAWAAVEPVVGSWQGNAMTSAAVTLNRLGRREEAVRLGRSALDRYPESDATRDTLAEILWSNGNYGEAAEILEPPRFKPASVSWRDLFAKTFRRVFDPKRDKEAVQALDALLQRHVNWYNVQCLVDPIAADRRFSLAFELQSRINGPRGHDLIHARLRAFKYLKAWKGPGVATPWFASVLPSNLNDMAAIDMFDEREFSLLWEVVQPTPGRELSSLTWALRAAAMDLSGPEARRPELMSHYSSGPAHDLEGALGRCLLKLESCNAAMALARTPAERNEASYFLGLKAIGDRQYREAGEWLELSLVEGGDSLPVYSELAWNTFRNWQLKFQSLDKVASQSIW
jgi:hypothetical protein